MQVRVQNVPSYTPITDIFDVHIYFRPSSHSQDIVMRVNVSRYIVQILDFILSIAPPGSKDQGTSFCSLHLIHSRKQKINSIFRFFQLFYIREPTQMLKKFCNQNYIPSTERRVIC